MQELAGDFPEKQWTGFDISPDAEQFWQRWAESPVTYRREDYLSADETNDLVLLIDLFEHVDDYIGFLRRLSGLGKAFVFHIPLDLNAQGLMRGSMLKSRAHVGHLHYFSKDTVLATLRDTGYEIKAWQFTGRWTPVLTSRADRRCDSLNARRCCHESQQSFQPF